MVSYTPEQQRIIRAIKRIGRKRGEKRVKVKAALETGAVESNYRNLAGGDADSQGWRQERASLYPNPRNVKASINRFYDEADKLYSGQHAGQLAADIQRPAAQYRDRYGQRSTEAKALLKGSGITSGGTSGGYSTRTRTKTVPDQSKVADAALSYLNSNSKNSIVDLASALSSADKTVTTTTRSRDKATLHYDAASAPRHLRQVTGVDSFEGVKVAAWIKPVLQYARQHGWKGSVESGYRSYAKQKAIYDSGVRPAAVPGTSNHEGSTFPRGAVDVSDAQQLAQIIGASKYKHLLQYAGSKDPVHFSHPHGGGY